MSALAILMEGRGASVSGSDLKTSPITDSLVASGISVFEGHREENVPPDADVVVYSSCIRPENPEMLQAEKTGARIISRSAFLKEVLTDTERYKGFVDKHPEFQDLYTRVVHLYEQITERALENEKKAG